MKQLAQRNRGLPTVPPDPGRPAPYRYPEPMPQDAGASAGGGVLLDYVQILRRRKWTILLTAALGGVAALLITLPQTPVYQVKATLEVRPVNENFLNMRDVNPTAGEPTFGPEYDIQTQVKVLESTSILKGTLTRMGIATRELPADAVGGPIAKILHRDAKPTPKEDLALDAAEKNLKVRARLNTRLIEIMYDSTDPAYAADFANALVAELIERNLQTRWESAQRTSEWLTRQMRDLKHKLEQSQDELQRYARGTGLTFMGEKDNLAEQKLRQVQDELSRAQAERYQKQSRYELAANASVEALPEVRDDASLKDYESKITDLRRQLAELSASFTSAHPKIKRVEAEIATLEAARQNLRNNIVERTRNEFEAARRRERLLSAEYDRQLALVSSQGTAVNRYNVLKGEVDTERQLYESMVQRVKEAGVASALRASNIQVVDPAAPPKAPYKPNTVLNTTLGLLSGMFFGMVFSVVRTRSDRSIQEPGDAALYLETSELGVIPSAASALFAQSKKAPPVALSIRKGPPVPDHPEVTFWNAEPSALAESFRTVLTSILFSGDNGSRPRLVVLSSPNPGEGKTMVVSNLAIALARTNMRVLLIDGDLRRPRVHDIFGLDNRNGFSDALLYRGNDRPPVPYIETPVPGLAVLPSGSSSDTNLLYTRRLDEIFSQLRREFDMILVDSPPMLQMPDARVLARRADGVILVVRSRKTTKDAAFMARQRLAEDGAPFLGTILNDWDPKQTAVHGYERYYERYRPYGKS